ncbi:MAG: hypothetical protein LBD97_08550 [Bifidobacteriaceae bacterium]|jgi:hypothetical protein|nr:hypothetical protein [Bifidobacteriaceae bacterium]
MAQTLADLARVVEGREIILLGNGPTVTDWDGTVGAGQAVATVNAGLSLLARMDRQAHLTWIQDERFLRRRSSTLLPHIARAGALVVNERIIPQLPPNVGRRAIGVRMLGYVGFSRDPRIGVFHGYNAVHGILQILAWARVRSVQLWGVPLLYWSTNTRFDQAKRGSDVDLHRASDQVSVTLRGIETVRQMGVEVTIHSDSALSRAVLPA